MSGDHQIDERLCVRQALHLVEPGWGPHLDSVETLGELIARPVSRPLLLVVPGATSERVCGARGSPTDWLNHSSLCSAVS